MFLHAMQKWEFFILLLLISSMQAKAQIAVSTMRV